MRRPFFLSIVFIVLTLLACAGDNEPAFRFVFMTDVHFTADRNAPRGLAQAIRHVNALKPKPDFVITGGDLIMDAMEASEAAADSLFNAAKAAIDSLEMPVYHTIGNHEYFGVNAQSDIPTDHPRYADKMFTKHMGYARPYHAFTHGNWHFVMLNSIGLTEDRQYYGHVDSLQLAWLKADLTAHARGKTVVLVTHIPLYSVAMQMMRGPLSANPRELVITNAQEVMAVLEPYDFRLALQGHLHIVEEMAWRKAHFITGGAVCAAWWNGANAGFEEGFVVVDVKGDDFSWQYVDYNWTVEEE